MYFPIVDSHFIDDYCVISNSTPANYNIIVKSVDVFTHKNKIKEIM